MALLAEEIIEEWLNRQGYFTIRGIKIGVNEIDLLAVRLLGNKGVECRHVEVQCSMNPVGYISEVPKEVRKKTGRTHTSAKKRSEEELKIAVEEWIEKKFLHKKKVAIMKKLCSLKWTKELVINVVNSDQEINLMKERGVVVHKFKNILSDLNKGKNEYLLKSASGADLVSLIMMGIKTKNGSSL